MNIINSIFEFINRYKIIIIIILIVIYIFLILYMPNTERSVIVFDLDETL